MTERPMSVASALARTASTRLLAAALMAQMAGCAHTQAQVRAPAAPGPAPLEVLIGLNLPPPPAAEGPHPRSPGRDFIWIGGAWYREGERWLWREGRWDRPPVRGARWIGPVARQDGQGYRYEPGHWSNQKVVEGEAYRKWKKEHGGDHGHR